jgi:inner membrane protein involved in colicin E2 resistance
LLVGAVVVFVALALAMYLTRRIDWYAPAETEADRPAS